MLVSASKQAGAHGDGEACACMPQPALTPSHPRLLIVLAARGRPWLQPLGAFDVLRLQGVGLHR